MKTLEISVLSTPEAQLIVQKLMKKSDFVLKSNYCLP